MPSDNEIYQQFSTLWSDVQSVATDPEKRPLLAHYTSIDTLEKIMANDEIWFSNPLFMNDFEELRFGINEGARCFFTHKGIESACDGSNRYEILKQAFQYQLNKLSTEESFDTYVFCASEHTEGDSDGLLSMWRGYGANGVGAAIVFDTNQISPKEGSPFIISKVTYASTTERIAWINKKLDGFADLISKTSISDDKLFLATHALLERIKTFTLFTKHHGFHEEKEWRIVYLRDRDKTQIVEEMLDYIVGEKGIEPKLKCKVNQLQKLVGDDFEFKKLIASIVIGPSLANPLAIAAIKRMLDKVGKADLQEKVKISSTPFRMI